MKEFFNYSTTTFHTMNFLERIIPLTLIYTVLMLIFIYKDRLRQSKKLNDLILYSIGTSLIILFIMNFVLALLEEEPIKNNLPLDFLSISLILSIALIFTKSKLLYHVTFYTGLIGSLFNLLLNDPGFSSMQFRYYVFIIGFSINLITAIYFLIIYNYLPKIKQTIVSFIILQIYIIGIFSLNSLLGTEYIYLTFGENSAPSNHLIGKLGKWPLYFIYIEGLLIISSFLWHGIIRALIKTEDEVDDFSISVQSSYISKKKKSFNR